MSAGSDRRVFLKQASLLAAATPFALTTGCSPDAGSSGSASSGPAPVADTRDGKVRGQVVNGINVFRGIPYGGDTSGKNRFMPPTKVEPWTGVRDALEWGHVAPQPLASGNIDYTSMNRWLERPGGESEDCLVLNVFTPALKDGGKRPVMFSIHGGGFTSGTSGNPVFDGVALAKLGDVVMVSINHRLGCLGYLELGDLAPEFEGSGVVGMMDLVAALEWVRDNIESFGGDPAKVMIFGQSGGGSKVSHLLVMPSATGLFHRAAIQSGAALRSGTRETANATAERMLAQIGITKDRVRELQDIPLQMMVGAQAAAGGRFGPYVDGKVIPANPFDPTAPAVSADVPVIVGSNLHDSAFQTSNFELDEAGLREQAETMFGAGAARVVAAYRAADPQAPPFKLLARMATDRGTRRDAITLAERKAALGRAPAHVYLLTYESVPFGGKFGSVHGTEMPLFYHNLDGWPIAGTGPDAVALADRMAGAYIAFAKTGKPTIPGIGEWPAFTADTRATMIFDVNTRVENGPHQELVELVAEYAVQPQAPPRA
jgi:para-nitrobenzyl esterase